MNKQIKQPCIVNFVPKAEDPQVVRNGNRIVVPVNAPWPLFKETVETAMAEDFDAAMVHINKGIDLDEVGTPTSIEVKVNLIKKLATNDDKPVLNKYDDGVWYLLNPVWGDDSALPFAPINDDVLAKMNATIGAAIDTHEKPEMLWQEHQANIWGRMKDLMPLSDGTWGANHIETLTDPGRGFEGDDLDEFWSWKSGRNLNPSVLGDDMIGMPGISALEYEGFSIFPTQGPNAGSEVPIAVRSLRTLGPTGIVIPMRNAEGQCAKFQIANDVTTFNIRLQARAADGVSIQKTEIFNEKKNEYMFTVDGQPSHLRVVDAKDGHNNVKLADCIGEFRVSVKQDIRDVLVERGYDVHPMIDTLRVVPSAKYAWLAQGDLVGDKATSRITTPSNAGFIVARKPQEQDGESVVVVVEGALKGHIVAKYIDRPDAYGQSVGDSIAGDKGIIIAQVPGVSQAFIDSVRDIYRTHNVSKTYVAMDADGRENYEVARGIENAYNTLSKDGPVEVMSWDPTAKGLDDALLAVSRNELSVDALGLRFGTAQELFPKSEARKPNPWRLDGTRANGKGKCPTWAAEYEKRALAKDAIKQENQAATQARHASAKDIINGGESLASSLPAQPPANAMTK